MKTLGLLGGLTYHATIIYYKEINDYIQEQLGGGHSANLVLHSFDAAGITGLFRIGKYEKVSEKFVQAAKNLKNSGADAIVLCANTAHMFAGQIEKDAGLPLLHIIDFSAEAIKLQGLQRVGLLGTKATMEGDFIRDRLEQNHGLTVLLPKEEVRTSMDDVIFGDLAQNIVTDQTKNLYLDAVRDLADRGAEGIILGCTELQFVLKPKDVAVPLFDTVRLHAKGVAKWALDDKGTYRARL